MPWEILARSRALQGGKGVWRQRDEQRPSRPPHPPPWHLNLKLRSAAGTRLFGAAGKRSLPTIRYFSLRVGFKIGSEIPTPGPRPPVQLSGFGGFFVPEPSPRQAAKARGQSAASRRAPRGRRTAGRRGPPRGPASPSRRAQGARRSRPGRRLEPGEREGAKFRGNERRAEAGRTRGKRAPSACGRGAAAARRGGAQLTTWTPLTWGAR